MERIKVVEMLTPYKQEKNISYAFETLSESDDVVVSNDDVRLIYECISKSLDNTFCGDDNHPMWEIEKIFSKSYKYPNGKTAFEVMQEYSTRTLE